MNQPVISTAPNAVTERGRQEPKRYDAVLLASFGGPEGQDDVIPFLRNVTRGRGIPDERLGEIPVAILHRREGSNLSEDDLRDFLSGRLAAFKIPARMIFADEPLPRLGTGKIDRVALKQEYTG